MTQTNKKLINKLGLILLTTTLATSLVACSSEVSSQATTQNVTTKQTSTDSSKSTDYFSNRDLAGTYDESTATKITLSGSSANISGNGATLDGSTLKITEEGTYILSGSGENIQVYIDAPDTAKVQVVLNNVTLSNKDAAFVVQEADKVFLTLAEGSTNTIKDSSSNSKTNGNAAVFSRSDLTINGKGTLNVEGNYQNAIESNDDLKIAYATLNVSAKKHALSANDVINAIGATLNLTSTEDAIHSDNDEDSTLGNVYLEDNTIKISAGDDGIHGSNAVVINGGVINIAKSTEGIEGKTVTIDAGDITVNSTDDGINAASGTSTNNAPGVTTAGVEIIINGGKITVNASGDGIDSNGNITITGGDIYVNGPTDNGNAAFDYDGTATITGGNAYIVGSSGMAQGFGGNSTQASIMANVQGSAGAKIVVTDSSGKEIANFTATKQFGNVLVSTKDLVEGQTYTISVNGNTTTATASKTTQGAGGFGGGFGGGAPGGQAPGGQAPGGNRR